MKPKRWQNPSDGKQRRCSEWCTNTLWLALECYHNCYYYYSKVMDKTTSEVDHSAKGSCRLNASLLDITGVCPRCPPMVDMDPPSSIPNRPPPPPDMGGGAALAPLSSTRCMLVNSCPYEMLPPCLRGRRRNDSISQTHNVSPRTVRWLE